MAGHLDLDAWNGKRKLVDDRLGAAGVQSLAQVGIGSTIYTDPERRRDSREQGVGGVVVNGPFVALHPETGEIVDTYLTLDLVGTEVKKRRVRADEIALEGCRPPEAAAISRVVRTLDRLAAKRPARSLLDEEDGERIVWRYRLWTAMKASGR